MSKTLLVVFLLMNDGSIKTEVSQHILVCPPQPVVFAKYEARKKEKEFSDWAATCMGIKFDKPPHKIGV